MTRLSPKQQEEFFFILERENKKLNEIFSSIKLKNSKFSQTFNLAQSYYQDMIHFFKKKEHVKAFELQNYIWGLLDSLAIIKAIQIPKEMQKWFKADF
jgi:hypothetical protein